MKNNNGCLIVVVLFLVLACCAASGLIGFILLSSTNKSLSYQLSTEEIKPGDNANQIQVIDITGEIISGESQDLWGNVQPDMVSIIEQELDSAKDNSNVKGVILRFNTPGGTVFDSFALADRVNKFQEDTKKPVVALIETSAASGGYLIASQTDYIVSNKTSVVGSIGVIVEIQDTKELMQKLGVKSIKITSDGAEQKAGERYDQPGSPEYVDLKKLLNDYQGMFNDYVQNGRKLSSNQIKELANGSIVSGQSAKESKLIDEIGDIHAAIDKLSELTGVANPRVFTAKYNQRASLFGSVLYQLAPALTRYRSNRAHIIFSSIFN